MWKFETSKIMKNLILIPFFLLTFSFCQAQKQELIEQVLFAIKNSEGANYESTTIIENPTPADTTIVIKFFSKFTYMMSEHDTLYNMSFRYDKREKTFNFDRLKSLVYNGKYYYSVEKINNNQIPAPSYRIQDLSKSSGKTALDNSIEGQIPFIFKYLSKKNAEEITLKNDTVHGNKKYYRLTFMVDPIYEFEVWIDNKTFMPARVMKIAYINRKKPQLCEINVFENFQFFKNGKGEIENSLIVDQFSVSENAIQYIPDENRIIRKLLPKGTMVPEIKESSVLDSPVYLSGTNSKIKLIYFGMINCCPCIKSIPHLKKISDANINNGQFEMIAFYPFDPPAVLKRYVEKENLNFTVCAGGKEIIGAFGLHSYPDILLTDKNGKVHKWYNYSDDMSDKIISEINKLLQ